MIADLGGEAILFPAIEIELQAENEITRKLQDAGKFDLVVFVSPNAARAAMPAIRRAGEMLRHVRLAAVGAGTATELEREGAREIIVPDSGFDSEALMETLRALRPQPRRVLIVRGEGGREWLAESMRTMGAEVEYLECYRRLKPARCFGDLPRRWHEGVRRGCVATSAEIVANLFAMAGDGYRDDLQRVPFFVSHPRRGAGAGVGRVVRPLAPRGAAFLI